MNNNALPPNYNTVEALVMDVCRFGESRIRSRRGSEIILAPCPIGGCKGDKFAINQETGLWNCPKCSAKGNAWQLAKTYKLEPVQSVRREPEPQEPRQPQAQVDAEFAKGRRAYATNEAVRKFVAARGITDETAEHFELCALDTTHTGSYVGFPYKRDNGSIGFIKWRCVTNKGDMMRLPTKAKMPFPAVTPLFNGHALIEGTVVLTEGELDAMVVYQSGIRNVASVANGAVAWDEGWSRQLASVHEIVVAFDNDEQGEKGAENLRHRFGRERVLRMKSGRHKDANDALLAGWSNDDFGHALEAAKREPPEILRPLYDIAAERVALAKSGARPEPLMTGHPSFDETQRGLRPAELTVATAHTGMGKTSWLLDLALRMSLRGTPVCFLSMEQPPGDTAEQLLSMIGLCAFEDMRPEDMEGALAEVPEHFYVGAEPERNRVSEVVSAIRFARIVYGIRIVIVDHLDFLIETKPGESRYAAATQAVQAMHAAARDNNIHIILVCQPTADSGRGGDKRRRTIGIADIAETRAARQLANNGWVFSANKETRTGNVYVEKARYGPAQENVTLHYDFDGFRFTETGFTLGRSET